VYKLLLFLLVSTIAISSFAQQKTFDIVSYTAPTNWTEQTGGGNISYSRIDGSSWAQIAIYARRQSDGDINTDFDKDWKELVATGKTISAPDKTGPKTSDGFMVMSGSGVWQYKGANVASILTVYSNKNICIAVLCNTTAQPYAKEYKNLISSINLEEAKATQKSSSSQNTNTENGGNASIVGIWAYNLLETSGYANGYPQYTAGYFRLEYTFKSNGTYTFFRKNWSAYQKNIMYLYETGTYTVNGNQITINPKSGKNEEWSKKDNRNSLWGNLVKSETRKSDKETYTFAIKYFSGSKDYSLELYSDKQDTEREHSNAPTEDGKYRSSYTSRKEPLIDLPPGFKLVATSSANTSSQQNFATGSTQISSPIANKIWEGKTLEKTGSGNMQTNTGGFFSNQYQFNADGTYRFVNVNASALTNSKSLNYETGTYTVNGNQLTVMPAKGANEEWSIVGKTSNGNSDVGNRKILESWGKKTKSSIRKLEKYAYTFSIANNAGKTALVMERSKRTEREGEGKTAYLNETPAANATKIPNGY
jgi:hypothetical protein